MRNNDRHGQDIASQEALRRQIVKSQLQELYEFRNKVCPRDSHIFHNSIEDHLHHHSISAVEDWIHTYKTAIPASAQLASQLGIRQTRALTEYPMFNPIGRPRQQASLPAGPLPG